MYEIIKFLTISTSSVLIFQLIIMNTLRNFSYPKTERFKQTKLLIGIWCTLILSLTYLWVLEDEIEVRYKIYNYTAIIVSIFILIEFAIRNDKFKNKVKSKNIEKNENPEISKFALFFYRKDLKGNIEPKKRTKILNNVAFILILVNVIFITLMPTFLVFNIIDINNRIYVMLTVITICLTEFYLFSSQIETSLYEKEKRVKLLQTPEEWNKEIENKYGSEIIGYSNHTSTQKTETSTTLNNLETISRDIIDGENVLISNSSKQETKAIYYNAINRDFINKKVTLIIYEDIPSLKEAEGVINSIIKEYNNELIVKIISKFQTSNVKVNQDINIYLTTLYDLMDSNLDYSKVQTVILNNTDKIIEKNSNELYVLATTLKNLNNDFQYIMLSVATDALRIAIRNILLIDSFKEYQINRKRALQTFGVQVLKRYIDNIKNHEKSNISMNDLIKLAIETNRFAIDNVEIVSKKMPILDDAKRFDEIRGARNNSLTNKELNKLTNRIKINCNSLFQENANKKMFIKNDDERNLLYSIKAYSELNNGETYLGVVSSDYLLRDYIISEYLKKKNDFSDLDILIPQTMQNDLKILLGALLMQMLNLPVKEEVIIRRLKEYNNEIILIEGYNRLSIITAINSLLESEFNIKTDITSYLIETIDAEGKKEYMLNSNFKTKLPRDLYEKSKIIISGYEQEVTNSKGYEIYQKYIPGQIHLIENKVYKIGNIENLDINVSNVSAEGLRKYKHDLNVNLSNIKTSDKDEDIRECSNVIMKTEMQKADVMVDTLGFYEFLDYTTLEEGAYVYRTLLQKQKEKMIRKYYNTRILKLEIRPKDLELVKRMQNGEHDKIACTLAFLINEIFETLLDENVSYVISKAVVADSSIIENEEIKLYRPIVEEKADLSSIVIYIIEDLKISKGLLTTIENEIPRIFSVVKRYLEWHENSGEEGNKYINRININNVLVLEEMKKILPIL